MSTSAKFINKLHVHCSIL